MPRGHILALVFPRSITFWSAVLLWTSIAAGLGLYGWWEYETEVVGREVGPVLLLTVVRQTLGLFFAETPSLQPQVESIWLLIASLMAPLVTVGALVRVGMAFFSSRLTARRIRRLKGHSVVCGSGSHAIAFARSERRRGNHVVLLSADASSSDDFIGNSRGFDVVRGDPVDSELLRAAAVPRAARLLIALAEDGENLEVAMQASALVESRSKTLGPLLANVLIRRRHLWRQLVRSDAIARSREAMEILPFNLSASAARHFTWEQPLWRYAWLRDHSCIHAVFFGYDDYTEALIGQLPPACTHAALGRPIFSILTSDPRKARSYLEQAFPAHSTLADIQIFSFDAETDALDEARMLEVSDRAPVTAVFVCRGGSEASLAAALDVREAMRRNAAWGAPLYVHLHKCEGIARLLVDTDSTRRFEDVIEAFGVEDRICDLALLEGPLETIAQRFHENYQQTRASEGESGAERRSRAALSDWRKLDESLRDANRRAADNVPAKLGSAGCLAPGGFSLKAPASFRLYRDECELDRLAEMEHRSWMASRYIDGWRYAHKRNDVRKHHPDLIAYSELDDSTREYDRTQVQFLNRHLIERIDRSAGRNDLIRREHRIGLVASEMLTPKMARRVCERIQGEMLPEMLKDRPDAHVTLITSLLPGPELIAARCILDFLSQRELSHGLIVIENARRELSWERIQAQARQGYAWHDIEVETEDERCDPTVLFDRIRRARTKLMESRVCEWVVEIEENHAVQPENESSETLLARYISRKSNRILSIDIDSGAKWVESQT